MADFNSLTTALEGWFDKPLADLPGEQQQRIRDDFFPMPWDSLNEDQRRSVAAQMDYLERSGNGRRTGTELAIVE